MIVGTRVCFRVASISNEKSASHTKPSMTVVTCGDDVCRDDGGDDDNSFCCDSLQGMEKCKNLFHALGARPLR